MSWVPAFLRRGPWRHLSDVDVWHSLAVAALACVLTCGLLFVAYFIHALHVAISAPTRMQRARTLLLFGKRLQAGQPDADYLARIARAHEQIVFGVCDRALLLGGASPGEISEAAAAQQELSRLGVPAQAEILLEDASIDTLENLRNARDLLIEKYGQDGRFLTPAVTDERIGNARLPASVALVSSRYHLARCALLARQLGFDYELVAAEDRFVPSFARLRRLVLEAGYILWADIGTRWARLICNDRMLRRVT